MPTINAASRGRDPDKPRASARPRLAGRGKVALKSIGNVAENDGSEVASPCAPVKVNGHLLSNAQAAALVSDPAFRRRMQRFWPLGSYVGAHLLAELAVQHGCLGRIEQFCDRVDDLGEALVELGLDQWPPLPLRVVPS